MSVEEKSDDITCTLSGQLRKLYRISHIRMYMDFKKTYS